MSLQYAIAECVERTITRLNEIEPNTSPKYSMMASGKPEPDKSREHNT